MSGGSAAEAVQVRAQGVGGEVRLPQPRGQPVDLAWGVAVDALGHLEEVVLGVGVVDAAGDHQALRGGHGADLAAAEGPVFPTHRNRAQGPLQVVAVDGDLGVVPVGA